MRWRFRRLRKSRCLVIKTHVQNISSEVGSALGEDCKLLNNYPDDLSTDGNIVLKEILKKTIKMCAVIQIGGA